MLENKLFKLKRRENRKNVEFSIKTILHDKGKPVERRGRKAMGLIQVIIPVMTARLPKDKVLSTLAYSPILVTGIGVFVIYLI